MNSKSTIVTLFAFNINQVLVGKKSTHYFASLSIPFLLDIHHNTGEHSFATYGSWGL